MKGTRTLFLSCAGAAALAGAIGWCAPAFAQTAANADDTGQTAPAKDEDTNVQDGDATQDPGNAAAIVVTGTNISGVKPVGSEAITLDREQILATGQTSPADVVRTLPQVRNLGEYREGGTQGGNNNQQGNAINLRGLGSSATLVLVDGHRVVSSGASQTFTEANQVPLAALERIEVIADGSSAVYGSDAVAGVVNFVTRRNYDGVEASIRGSNSNGGFEVTPGLTVGKTWDDVAGLGRGNLIVNYEYTTRDPYLRGKNPYLLQDLRQFGGADNRLSGTTATAGTPGNIYVALPGGAQNATLPRAGGNTYYGLPVGANDHLTPANLLLNQPNLVDSAYFTDYTGRLRHHHVAAFFNQELGSWLSLFVQGTYSNRTTTSRTLNTENLNVTLKPVLYNAANAPTATPNPYYIAGIPNVAPGSAINVQYNLLGQIGPSNWSGSNESYVVTGGLRASLPHRWKGEFYYTHGRDNACNYCQIGKNVDSAAVQYLIDTGAINPLSSVPLTSAQIAMFTGDNVQRSRDTADDAVLKFDGPLFRLPAGEVRAALGGERNKLSNGNLNGANRDIHNNFLVDTDFDTSRGERTIWSAFAELYVPIIGQDMEVPLVQSFTVDGAVRYDHYSDVGKTTNPKVGATWVVNDSLTLRGSWGTSFRAPALPDVNPQAISTGLAIAFFPNASGDPRIVNDFDFGPGSRFTTIAYVGGANPAIKPEEATTWSVGGDFKAPFDRNLKFSATYYSIKYNNRISGPDVFGAFLAAGGYPDYRGLSNFIIPIHNPAGCSNTDTSTLDPVLQAYLGRTLLYGGGINNPCSVHVLLDGRNTNLAATEQDGLDAQLGYFLPVSGGGISFDASVNKVFHNREQVSAGQAFVERLGYYNTAIAWRGRGTLGVFWHGFSANLFANYTGSYINDRAIDSSGNAVAAQKVDTYTTFDLNLGYSTEFAGRRSFMKAFRASVNFQNVTDKAPPIVLTSGSVFNGAYSNPFGRTVTVQLSTSF